MNIAELFVNLGIKGSEKTVGALTNVGKGLGEVKSMSLEAKAGILGAMYALERLVATSGAAGTGLTNFNAFTGLSARQLQQWQYAARQAGVTGEEFAGSVKSVQTAMTNMMMGKGAPEGLGLLANKVGFDPKKARDTFYVLEQLQKFARTVPNDIGNAVMKSFGLSEGTIAAMRRNSFSPELMARAPIYGDKEISTLDRANIAWSNLGNKIEMAVGHFNARHGLQLVKDISMVTDSVVKLAEALERTSEKFKVMETVGHAFEGIANTLKLFLEVSDKLGGKDSIPGDILYTPPGQEKFPGVKNSPMGKFFSDAMLPLKWLSGGYSSPSPAPSTGNIPVPATAPTVNVKQDLHFQHDGKDHGRTADSVKKAVQESYRQMSAQGQGS